MFVSVPSPVANFKKKLPQLRAAVICLCFAEDWRESDTQGQGEGSARDLWASVMPPGATNSHTVGRFATIWDPKLCDCSSFKEFRSVRGIHSPHGSTAQMFTVSMHSVATEHADFAVANCVSSKRESRCYMHDVLQEMFLEEQSIVGGSFSTNSNLMATYIDSFVDLGLLPSSPQLCMGESGWQACACIVNSDKCTASPDDMDKNETDTLWALEIYDCIRIKLETRLQLQQMAAQSEAEEGPIVESSPIWALLQPSEAAVSDSYIPSPASASEDFEGDWSEAMHSEAGHYVCVGTSESFTDRDMDVTASFALREAQNGMGWPLVNPDGSAFEPREPSVHAENLDDYSYPYPVYDEDDIVALVCMLVQHAFRKMPGETLERRARAVVQQMAAAYSDAVFLELANIAGLLSHHHGVLRDTAAVIEHWRECDQTRRQLIRRVSNWSCQTQPPFTHDDELGRAEVQQCFFQYGINFLQHQLQPHQKRDQRYVIQTNKQGQTRLDAFQRSIIQSVLWRRMGSKFVAFGIWQIGLPRIIASDDAVGKGLLQSCLTEVLGWLVRLVEAIDHRKGTAEHADHVRMSDPTQRTWSDDNRKRKWQESNKAKPMKPFRL